MKTINIITLGCAKNRVDSEHIAAQLAEAGYEVRFDSDRTDAKVVVVNTCGFIGDAKEESIDTILNCVEAKKMGLIEQVFVIGCLSERYADELREEIPEVDDYFGARTFDGVVRALTGDYRKECETKRELSTPKHYAYLKIGEGCNWRCGYCAIPLIRGKHRSVPMEELLEEAQNLANKGVKELMVVAQDTTYYGVDLYGKRCLAELLEKLCKVEGIEWIRLHYAYPTDFPQDVIEVMAREPKICKYLDIPLQHLSDNQLELMHRRHTKSEALALIERLRTAIPDIAIRTTMLVGYPNESAEDYEELCEEVKRLRFDRLGVFPYSEEEGTFSATKLSDNIPQRVKDYRAEHLMAIQADISHAKNEERVGKVERVIIDGKSGEYYIGRSQYDSPEVDEEILISSHKRLMKGKFYEVRITDADDFDLYAEIV